MVTAAPGIDAVDMSPASYRSRIPIALRVAAVLGLTHAVASAYWASGGRALLDTVGPWAVDAVRVHPVAAALGLAIVAAVKAAAALVPVAVHLGWSSRPRLWRGVSWAGSLALIVYGGANAVVGQLVLLGIIGGGGGYDHAAMLGHALLWDPLFLLWGAALGAFLWRTRPAGADEPPERRASVSCSW